MTRIIISIFISTFAIVSVYAQKLVDTLKAQ